MRCTAQTKKGKPCRNNALHGQELCQQHSGEAGRHTKLTPEVMEELDQAIGAGVPQAHAAALAGIHQATFYRWMEHGEADIEHDKHTLQREFREMVERARARSVAARVGRIAKAGLNGHWQADAWWLERTYPEMFGRRDRYEAKIEHGGKIEVQVVDDEVERLMAQLATGGKAPSAGPPTG